MQLIDALNLWLDVSGADKSNDGGSNIKFSDYETRSLSEGIREALELDDTEETGRLFFEYVVREYFSGRTFSVELMLDNPQLVKDYLDKSSKLMSYIESDEVKQVSEMFCGRIVEALQQYNVTNPKVFEFVSDRIGPAVLRRDALRSMKNLRVSQFLRGDFCPPEVKPVYGKHIYRWWNINSMLAAMVNMPNGVTLNAVCNPVDPTLNYFCFAIKNGGNLFVFTDKEKSEHPLQDGMRRRPDRDIANRAFRNWFPYESLGLKYSEETGEYYMDLSDSTAIAPYQKETDLFMPISALKECELVWVTMMFDLIVSKFWKGEYQAPQLSYTGDMVKVQTKLIENATKANLPVKSYIHIESKALTIEDVYHENVTEAQVGKKYDSNNLWLELRYRHLVNDSVLNVMAPPDRTLGYDSTKGQEITTIPAKREGDRFFHPERFVELKHFDSTAFGTKEDLENDRVFVARANMAKMIMVEAEKEFKAREKQVKLWVSNRIRANIRKTCTAENNPELRVSVYDINHKTREYSPFSYGGWSPVEIYSDSFEERKGRYGNCMVTGAKSSLFGVIEPKNSADLAYLCGCEIDELPDVLQHWTYGNRYTGNNILDRIDPMNWALKNPWAGLNLKVIFYMSKTGYKQLYGENFNEPNGYKHFNAVRGFE